MLDPAGIFYRNTELDPDRTSRLVADALHGCDDGELFLQYVASESFSFDDGRLKAATFDTQQGFGLRGVAGETTAYAHANELSDAAIRRAGETIAVVRAGHGGNAALNPAAGHQPPPLHRRRSAERGAVRDQDRAAPEDRRRGARQGPARRAGVGQPARVVVGRRDRPRRRPARAWTCGRWSASTSTSSRRTATAARPASTGWADVTSTTRCSTKAVWMDAIDVALNVRRWSTSTRSPHRRAR